MGLDMYLERCDRSVWGYKDMDIDEVKKNNPNLYQTLKPFIVTRGNYYHWESLFEEVGYWRKANAIHKWFVDNVQDGVDDCGTYEVSKEKLENLLEICNDVVYKGKQVAQTLLPTQEGFFFGSTDYDDWYMKDIKNTITILTKVLKETDFERQMVVYSSSW